jgi:hypothetical protein
MSNRYGSNLSFNDVLFNALLGFVVLFVLALLLINPITKKSDIPAKAEILITLEWEDESADDIDITAKFSKQTQWIYASGPR